MFHLPRFSWFDVHLGGGSPPEAAVDTALSVATLAGLVFAFGTWWQRVVGFRKDVLREIQLHREQTALRFDALEERLCRIEERFESVHALIVRFSGEVHPCDA